MRQFDYNKIKDPEYFAENRMKAHSDHQWFSSRETAMAGEEEFKVSLNGLWKFSYARNYASAIKGFENLDYSCREWEDIKVPAHIQLEGYDAPQYVNTQYPWDGHASIAPGEIPVAFNPVGSYVKYFYVPSRMKGEKVFISFQGVESGFALWCNGAYVGYSSDSFTPSEFELTEYLTDGENKLAVQVFKWTSGSWMEDQDFFRFSGIFREVYLYTIPKSHVYDLNVRAVADETLTRGALTVKAKIAGNLDGTIEVLLEASGAEGVNDLEVIQRAIADLKEECILNLAVENPELWSAESPNLYLVVINLLDKDGNLMETVIQKVGFKRFEMKNAIMHINGKRIVFKGVNRHEFDCDNGRVVSREDTLKDIITMKQNNMNAIRTSHYPNQSFLYDLCDEYGLYMIDEANLETHGMWQYVEAGRTKIEEVVPGDRPEWLNMTLDRANSMYQRDKNHTSILIWSCGNEAFGGKNLYEMSQFFRQEDDTRLVHYEGIHFDRRYNDTSDMESQMYTPVEQIKEFLANDRSKPFISCEYTHAMGNSCGAMHKYTDLTDTDPSYQGGFIWDYVDQSLRTTDRYGNETQGYGGDFGERPTDYNFCGNGIVYGARGISPKMQEVKFNYQNISIQVEKDKAHIINKNLFTNTSEYDCFITVEKEGVLQERVQLLTDIEPLSEKTYEFPLRDYTKPGEYVIFISFVLKEDTLWAKRGHEVAFGQGIFLVEAGVKEPDTYSWEAKIAAEDSGTRKSLEIVRGLNNIGIKGEHFEALFSYLTGGLVSYKYGGREMIQSIPKPNFWRAPNDNDGGNKMAFRYSQWKIASLYLNHAQVDTQVGISGFVHNPTLEEKEDCAVVTFTYYMPTTPASSCQLSYTVFGDGTIQTKLSYDPVKELGDMPEFGVMFKLSADYCNVEWYGNGPEETYADRKHGAKLGVYRNQVKDNMAKYLVPQECGNKTEVRYAKVTDHRGRGFIFVGDKMNFSALPFTPHELENAVHDYELPPVHYTVVRVSGGQMGVAGDDTWGARTHEEYLLDIGKKMEFQFSFKGIVE